jgi:two-component system chemotaxis response regulator CheB
VQHLPSGFAASFATFLSGRTKRRVAIASTTTALTNDMLVVAPDDRHLVMKSERTIAPDDGAPRNGHRPSVDVLFESIARTCGSKGCAILLTGIGSDGVEGMVQIREASGLTIAQDESAAVFGMPRAAMERGAASVALDLESIALVLSSRAKRSA